jgi:tRNA uridine 5-carbamoylmethylation protein Kti12
MTLAIIMRGLPGSGKDHYLSQHPTFANAWRPLRHPIAVRYANAPRIVSADDAFVSEEGKFQFEPSGLNQAHIDCVGVFLEALRDNAPVAVSNTNSQRFEMAPYIMAALASDYAVRIVHIAVPAEVCVRRNVHGVPRNVIENMAADWEQPPRFWPREELIDEGTQR